MARKIVVDPITRIEGHLRIEAQVEFGLQHARQFKLAPRQFAGEHLVEHDADGVEVGPAVGGASNSATCWYCQEPFRSSSSLAVSPAASVVVSSIQVVSDKLVIENLRVSGGRC